MLGELFFGQKFGFMSERTDIGNYMKAINSLLPTFTIGGTVPSYLMSFYSLSTTLFSPGVQGALGAVKHIATASKTAVNRRKQELEANKEDQGCDMLRKMLDINKERGEKIDFTLSHIGGESRSSL